MFMGDIVIVVGIHTGHQHEHPGIITRVHPRKPHASLAEPINTNITVFRDGQMPSCMTGLATYDSLAQANAAAARMPFAYLRSN